MYNNVYRPFATSFASDFTRTTICGNRIGFDARMII